MLACALASRVFTREMLDTSVRSPRDIPRLANNLLGINPRTTTRAAISAGIPLRLLSQAHVDHGRAYRHSHASFSMRPRSTRRDRSSSPPWPQNGIRSSRASRRRLGASTAEDPAVDANFRRPELKQIFNVPNDVGFSNAAGDDDNSRRDHSTPVPEPRRADDRHSPANPTSCLESQCSPTSSNAALEEYITCL